MATQPSANPQSLFATRLHGGFGEMIEVGMVDQLANSSAISNL